MKFSCPLRSLNPYGVKRAWIPLGDSAESRKKMQSDWQFRLKSEIYYYHFKRKFNVGFLTLTYNDVHLPHVPRRFFKRGEYRKIPCFSYIDVKRFTTGIRNFLFREYGLTDGYRFFLSSEYGEKKHRPHYHLILLFDSCITHQKMYDVCSDLWCGTELVIPNNPKSKRKRRHLGIVSPFSDFVPRDSLACGSYCSKYVCKDLEFYENAGDSFSHLTKRQKDHLRWFLPFHKQSRSFGSCILADRSDEELLKMYVDGVGFPQSRTLFPVPHYIEDKLLFTYQKRYNIHSHREETIKKYSRFFYDYYDVVYKRKFLSVRSHFEQLMDSGYWKKRSFEYDFSGDVRYIVDCLGLDDLVRFNLLYFGVPFKRCRVAADEAFIFFSRFDPCADLESCPRIDYRYYGVFHRALNQIFSFESSVSVPIRSDYEKLLSQICAFHHN